jgi:hypothetical protein
VVVETLTVVANDAMEKAAIAPSRARSLRLLLGTSDANRLFHMSSRVDCDLTKNVRLLSPSIVGTGNRSRILTFDPYPSR